MENFFFFLISHDFNDVLVFVLSFSLQITFWFLSLHAMFNSLNIAVVFKIIFKMQITYSAMEV
jgi:hypothetical protein